MHPNFSDDAAALLISQLQAASARMAALRTRFEPIYTYYLPQSWSGALTRWFRPSKQPDFSRYRTELQLLSEEARETIESSKTAFEALATTGVDPQILRVAQLSYMQDHYDGTVIILMDVYVREMDEGHESALIIGMQLQEHAAKARTNLEQLKDATRRLS